MPVAEIRNSLPGSLRNRIESWSSAWLKWTYPDIVFLIFAFFVCVQLRDWFAKLPAMLLAISAAARLITRRSLDSHSRWGILFFLACVAASLLSFVNATSRESAWYATGVLAREAAVFIFALLLVRDMKMVRRLAWTLVGCGIFMGTISVYQYLTKSFSSEFMGFGQSIFENIVGRIDDYRIAGSARDPNYYAQIMLSILVLAIILAFEERRRVPRLLAIWAVIVCNATIFMTYSRGGFVALAVVLVLLISGLRPRWVCALVALALLLPGYYLVPRFRDRIESLKHITARQTVGFKEEPSFQGRLSENIAGYQMFRDHPLLGVGAGNYAVLYHQYSRRIGIDPRKETRTAHNLFLETASETGILGLITLLLFLGSMFYGLRKARAAFAARGFTLESRWVSGVGIALVAYLTAALFLSHDLLSSLQYYFLVGVAFAFPAIAEDHVRAYATASQGRNIPDRGVLS